MKESPCYYTFNTNYNSRFSAIPFCKVAPTSTNSAHAQSAPHLQGAVCSCPVRACCWPHLKVRVTAFRIAYRASLKGIVRFFYVIRHFVGVFLLPDIFLDGFFVNADCAYIISLTPEMPIAVFVFQIRKLLEDHQRTLPLEIPHYLCYAVFGRYP